MRLRLWPRSLAARTAAVLLTGLIVVQVAGLTIHAFDRLDLERLEAAREVAIRAMGLYRAVVMTSPGERQQVLNQVHTAPGVSAVLSPTPPIGGMPDLPFRLQRILRLSITLVPLPPALRPHEVRILGGAGFPTFVVGLRLPEGDWLNVRLPAPSISPWNSPTFMTAFLLMTAVAAMLTLWAVRRLTAPVRTLAAAAEALGRDVNAPPLPEDGPAEVATAAAAFNTMAARIRRFVQDRTELLTAIGHDLRTPITRLKLRCEFIEDEEQQRKMLADLEELEAMVSATLAFGRDAATAEPVTPLDLAELLRTVLDEAGDARPELVDQLAYDGPSHFTLRARPLAMKRALANLVTNALNYGGSARVRLIPPQSVGAVGRVVTIEVEDDGPGISAGDLERVFEPFHRGEPSRSRETGGVGLGLPIARNIFRAHGGDVTLANRPPSGVANRAGGLKATVTLPV